jgi:Zn-dependent protease
VTDFTLQQIVMRVCALIMIVAVHGAVVASTACGLGDQGPRHDGRLTLNPLAHLDLFGLVSGVLFSIGWIKPVTIDPRELRWGRGGLLFVVMAPAVVVVTMVLALWKARPLLLPLLGDSSSSLAFSLIETIAQLGIWFALLNLIPLPPFTGSQLLVALVPSWRERLRKVHIYAALLMIALAAVGATTGVLDPAQNLMGWLVAGQ